MYLIIRNIHLQLALRATFNIYLTDKFDTFIKIAYAKNILSSAIFEFLLIIMLI